MTGAAAVAWRGAVTPVRAVLKRIFVGVAVLFASDSLWYVTSAFGGPLSAIEPWADGLVLVGYVIILAATVRALAPTLRKDTSALLDAATVGVASTVTTWLAASPLLASDIVTTATRLHVLALAALIGGTIGFVIGTRASRSTDRAGLPTLICLVVALTIAAAANILDTLESSNNALASEWVDVMWLPVFVVASAGLAHPHAEHAFVASTESRGRLTPRRIVTLVIALAAAPLVTLAQAAAHLPVEWASMAAAQVALAALVMTRFGQLARAHRLSEARLQELADRDALTGLANRRAISERLEAITERVSRGESPGVVICYLDLDDFKVVNDTWGHGAGDELLSLVADRLLSAARSNGTDLVGRLGGDEFVVVFEGDTDALCALTEDRFAKLFASPFELSAQTVTIGASVGVASAASGESVSVDALLTEADHAMYAHKRAGETKRG